MKGGRSSTTMITNQEGGGWGLSWPPRFYTCNFCRREFRSAQALGGHMNVHRRDRARLRATPNPNPNPNPNPTQPTLVSSTASSSNHHNRLFSRYKHVGRSASPKKLLVVRKQGKVVKLGLEIGIFDHDDEDEDEDEEHHEETGLDLELRLGFSH